MTETATPMDIWRLLNGSNCRECGKPTCMAFAAAVFNGQMSLNDCPKLDGETLTRYAGRTARPAPQQEEIDGPIETLMRKLATIDLAFRANRLGATFSDGRLTLKCLGKDFSVDSLGNITTDLHVQRWIMIPVLNYIIAGAGIPVSGNWVPFSELKNGKPRYPLFQQQCERPCKRLADADPGLFEDVVSLFGGVAEDNLSAHISVVLKPLPRLPILIRYWKSEDGLESALSFLFDSTAAENLNIESIYILGTGLVLMFERIALTHGLEPQGA